MPVATPLRRVPVIATRGHMHRQQHGRRWRSAARHAGTQVIPTPLEPQVRIDPAGQGNGRYRGSRLCLTSSALNDRSGTVNLLRRGREAAADATSTNITRL